MVTLSHQLKNLARTEQFYWFICHLLSFICFSFSLVESIFGSKLFYKQCLFFIIVTYVIVLKQIFKQRKDKTKSSKILNDENLQYFFIAIWFYFSSGKYLEILVSFNIFLVFHILNYFQNNLLPHLPLGIQYQNLINVNIKKVQTNYVYLLQISLVSEIFLVVSLFSTVVMSILLMNMFKILWCIITMTFMILFLNLKVRNNSLSKQIVTQLDQVMIQSLASNYWLNMLSISSQCLTLYTYVKRIVSLDL